MATTRVSCPTCDTSLELEEQYLGQEVQCGSCHEIFVAKAKASSRRRDDEERPSSRKSKYRRDVEDDDDDDLYDDDRPRKRRRRSRSGGGGGGGSGAGTISLVLGCFGILVWCCPLIGFPVTIIGLILGFVGLKADNKGTAIAGLVLNGLFLVATIINAFAGAMMNMNKFNRFNQFNQPQPRQQQPPWMQPQPPRQQFR